MEEKVDWARGKTSELPDNQSALVHVLVYDLFLKTFAMIFILHYLWRAQAKHYQWRKNEYSGQWEIDKLYCTRDIYITFITLCKVETVTGSGPSGALSGVRTYNMKAQAECVMGDL